MKTFHPILLNSRDSISTGKPASLHYKAKRTTGNHSIEISHFPMGNSFLIPCMNRSTNLLHILSLHIWHAILINKTLKAHFYPQKVTSNRSCKFPWLWDFFFLSFFVHVQLFLEFHLYHTFPKFFSLFFLSS